MAFFTPFIFVTLCQFHKEKRRFFAYMAVSAYQVISREVINHIMICNWIFRHTCCIPNPHLQISGIIISSGKHYILISDTLVGSFLDVLFLLLAVILLGLHEKPRKNKDWVTEKSTLKNLGDGYHFFNCTASFLCYFLLLSSFTPFPFPSDVLPQWTLQRYILLLWVVFCVMKSRVNGRKYESLL